jgi:hypothetical protein
MDVLSGMRGGRHLAPVVSKSSMGLSRVKFSPYRYLLIYIQTKDMDIIANERSEELSPTLIRLLYAAQPHNCGAAQLTCSLCMIINLFAQPK